MYNYKYLKYKNKYTTLKQTINKEGGASPYIREQRPMRITRTLKELFELKKSDPRLLLELQYTVHNKLTFYHFCKDQNRKLTDCLPYINYIFVTDINIIINFLCTLTDTKKKQIIYIEYCIPTELESFDNNEKKSYDLFHNYINTNLIDRKNVVIIHTILYYDWSKYALKSNNKFYKIINIDIQVPTLNSLFFYSYNLSEYLIYPISQDESAVKSLNLHWILSYITTPINLLNRYKQFTGTCYLHSILHSLLYASCLSDAIKYNVELECEINPDLCHYSYDDIIKLNLSTEQHLFSLLNLFFKNIKPLLYDENYEQWDDTWDDTCTESDDECTIYYDIMINLAAKLKSKYYSVKILDDLVNAFTNLLNYLNTNYQILKVQQKSIIKLIIHHTKLVIRQLNNYILFPSDDAYRMCSSVKNMSNLISFICEYRNYIPIDIFNTINNILKDNCKSISGIVHKNLCNVKYKNDKFSSGILYGSGGYWDYLIPILGIIFKTKIEVNVLNTLEYMINNENKLIYLFILTSLKKVHARLTITSDKKILSHSNGSFYLYATTAFIRHKTSSGYHAIVGIIQDKKNIVYDSNNRWHSYDWLNLPFSNDISKDIDIDKDIAEIGLLDYIIYTGLVGT